MPRKDRRFTCNDLDRLRPIAVCSSDDEMRQSIVRFIDFFSSLPWITPILQYALQFLAYAVEHSDRNADDVLREFFELMN